MVLECANEGEIRVAACWCGGVFKNARALETSAGAKRANETKIRPKIFVAALRGRYKDGLILFLGESSGALFVDELKYPAAAASHAG